MTNEEIKALFYKSLEQKALYNKLDGISRNQIYNWIHKRVKEPSIGSMVNVLYQLKKITIHENNRNP